MLTLAGSYVGTRSSFISDEGALIIQARMLSRGDGWVEHPRLLPQVDPSGRWYPLDNSDRSADGGFSPFAKHPLYALLAAGLYRIGGVPAIIALSVLGTWVAAVLAALLARRFHPPLDVPCLWAVGFASPLLFDAFLAQGHTAGAAMCAAAVLAAAVGLAATERGEAPLTLRTRTLLITIASSLVALCLFAATIFRTEAVIFSLAVAGVCTCFSLVRRTVGAAFIAAAALGGAFGARVTEHAVERSALGPGGAPVVSFDVANQGQSLLNSRIAGFQHTWMDPSHLPAPNGNALLVLLWAMAPVLAIVIRTKGRDSGFVRLVAGLTALLAVARLFVHPYVAVPGLLIAFPLLWGSAWLVRPGRLSNIEVVCVGIVGIFFAGVIATQYSIGGALEWGGRYFALGLPVIVPVAMVSCWRSQTWMSATSRRATVAAALCVSLALAVLSLLALNHEKADNAHLVAEIDRMSRPTGTQPVVVSIIPWLARISWPIYDHEQMLYVPPDQLPLAARRLRDAGVKRITFVSISARDYSLDLGGWQRVAKATFVAKARDWTISDLVDTGVAASATRPPGPSRPPGGAE
ncbi:MAG: hypothetical protein NVS3B21_03360 [Acidimicrobiales bacterium]